MKRREFIAGLGSGAAWPLVARAQQSKVPVVGFLSLEPISTKSLFFLEFRRGLAESGFFEGQNITFEFRVAGGNIRRWEIAQDLLNQHPAVVVASGSGFIPVLKAATWTVPIVFISGLDPINIRIVESFNRPGGNVTGINLMNSELISKRLNLLLELVPQAKIIGYLSGVANSAWTAQAMEAAKALGKEIVVQEVRQRIDIERQRIDIEKAFAGFAERGVSVITVAPDNFLAGDLRRSQAVVEFASSHKMPAVYGTQFFPRIGGLMSYSADNNGAWYQLGTQYVAPILKGAKPADLPVQQPIKFELVINLKTARTLGLEVPPNLLALADEVIE